MSSIIPYYSKINSVEFYVLGNEENRIDSCVNVVSKDIYRGEFPAMDGIYSPLMGTTDKAYDCATCGLSKGKCPGHFGVIELKYPVKSPFFRESILKWLKIVCFKCGTLLCQDNVRVGKNKILSEYIKLTKKINKCYVCDEAVKNVIREKTEPNIFYTISAGEKYGNHVLLNNYEIKAILNRITDESVIKLKRKVSCHPKHFILDALRVSPNTIRPENKRGGSRSNSNDITVLLKNIVDTNETLKSPEELKKRADVNGSNVEDIYAMLDSLCYEMIKGSPSTNNQVRMTSGGKAPKSLAMRIPKKEGRTRQNMMGKRVGMMMRSVITGDPMIKIDEIGIPVSVSKTMIIPETVQVYNRSKLQVLFNNKNAHPGASHVFIKEKNNKYDITKIDPEYVLKNGDIVYRHLMDNDMVVMNRQPSLTFASIGGHKVRVMNTGLNFRLNGSACKGYGADFDGDEMNGIVVQNIQSRVEVDKLVWLGNHMISYQNHAPNFGCFQDSIIGMSELTQHDIFLDKWHIMQMFSTIDLNTILSHNFNFTNKIYSGKDVISAFIPPINYPKKTSSAYMEQYKDLIDYHPDDTHVQIQRGKLISGSLDKATVSQGTMGSIFQVINAEYGTPVALNNIDISNQLIAQFFLYRGMSIGLKDILLDENSINEIKDRTASMVHNANEITNRLNNRQIVSPIGTSIMDFYEMEFANALVVGDDTIAPALGAIDFRTNALARLIFTGSKGAKTNFTQMNGIIGRQTLGGKSMPRNAGTGKTSPYFTRFDMTPRANGFIDTSLREGIPSDIFPWMAAETRHGETAKNLSTSVAGAEGRIGIKNMESNVINNLYQVAKRDNIIQLLFADTGIDIRKTEKVKILTVLISEKEFEQYHMSAKQFKHKNSTVQKYLDEEFEQLSKDRALYRHIMFKCQQANMGNYLISNEHQMPINPYRIIEDIIWTYGTDDFDLDPVNAIKSVRDLCDRLPYVYFNKDYENSGGHIPEYISRATTLIQILIRSYLNTANLLNKKVSNKNLDIIVKKIFITYKNALIDYGLAIGVISAQCLSEPMTQYIIDAKHRASGGGGTRFNVLDRIKEILGAKPTEHMKFPTMLIIVKEEFYHDKIKVQEIANNIEMMSVSRFIEHTSIFFEEYGNPVHPKYKHDIKLIRDFEKYSSGIIIPANLSKWCIRYVLNKEEMLMNNMRLDCIIIALRIHFPLIFFVHSPENANEVVIRCYLLNTAFKIPASGFNENIITNINNTIKNTIVRGIPNITNAEVISIANNIIDDDGKIGVNKIWAIKTQGSNLEEVLENPYVDQMRTTTDSIQEIAEMYGIDSARNKIIIELQKGMNNVITSHCSIFADEMTSTGIITSIRKTGLQAREMSNVSLRLSFQSPIQVLEEASTFGYTDYISGSSASLMNGQPPNIGTTYNDIIINTDFVEEYMKQNIDDEI